jgi:hypothetical protein
MSKESFNVPPESKEYEKTFITGEDINAMDPKSNAGANLRELRSAAATMATMLVATGTEQFYMRLGSVENPETGEPTGDIVIKVMYATGLSDEDKDNIRRQDSSTR